MRLKCGDTRKEDNKIFWAYDRSSKNGERWLSPEQFLHYKKRNAETAKDCYNRNPKAFRERNRNAQLKSRFGITPNEYESMLIEQNGVCFLCQKKCTTKKRLCVDHCHKTGKVRKLLCRKCNSGIGQLDDSIQLLEKAIEYIKKYS